MTRRQKDPLRPLTTEERDTLEQISRARSEPASHVHRAKPPQCVAAASSYAAAARPPERRHNDAVAAPVPRFDREGLLALAPRHGGRPATHYTASARERILCELRRNPDPEHD